MRGSMPVASTALFLAAQVTLAVFADASAVERDSERLYPTQDGQLVYDATQDVYWLANANLASDPAVRREMAVSGIDPNGAMNFQKALEWVAALNSYNHGAGYLGHNNWQLPVAPLRDATCADTGSGGGSFGPLCAGSALGNLFYIGLRATYPDGVAPSVSVAVPPFSNLPLSYFWASQNKGGTGGGAGGGGQEMFSFANGIQGGTTTNDIYYFVLPMIHGAIGNAPPRCTPNASKVVAYTSGPAAGKAFYDCATGNTWPIDANLAASNTYGISGNATITDRRATLRPPLISHGAMLFATARQWIRKMQVERISGLKRLAVTAVVAGVPRSD